MSLVLNSKEGEGEMALIDVIKFDAMSDEELVQKHQKEEIKLGSQLIVNQAQDAIFRFPITFMRR